METASAVLDTQSSGVSHPSHTQTGDAALEAANVPVDLPVEKTWVLIMSFKGKKQEVQITESDTVRLPVFLVRFLDTTPHFPPSLAPEIPLRPSLRLDASY